MPYITQDRRDVLDMSMEPAGTAGELNYLLTKLVIDSELFFVEDILRQEIDDFLYKKESLDYQIINDVLGAITGAKLEIQRRLSTHVHDDTLDRVRDKFYKEIVAPYEDKKIKANGDVFKCL